MLRYGNLRALMAAGAITLGMAGAANAITIPATSDPWLAGMPAGATAAGGDVAPDHSPVLVPDLSLSAGDVLTFGVTGSVSNTPSPSGLGPDGGGFISHSGGAENGIADLRAPINSLVGVFLGTEQPDLSPAPSGLDFAALGLDFASLSPLLKQPFFIGDGLTGTGSGAVQDFLVPSGATRLFLGTMDGFGWYNNSGAFEVTVNPASPPGPPAPAPEPATLSLLAGALAAAAVLRRRNNAPRA